MDMAMAWIQVSIVCIFGIGAALRLLYERVPWVRIQVARYIWDDEAPMDNVDTATDGQHMPDHAVRATGTALIPARIPSSTPLWMQFLNDIPQSIVHLFILGGTGSGKTTLTRALMQTREGQVLVITGKAGDLWPGLTLIGIDRDASYTTMQHAMAAMNQEVRNRLVRVTQEEDPGEQLTLIIDDYSIVIKETAPVGSETVKLIARIGRSLRIRLIILGNQARVKTLGIESEGDVLDNFVTVRMGPGRIPSIEYGGEIRVLNDQARRDVERYTATPFPPARAYVLPPMPAPTTPPALPWASATQTALVFPATAKQAEKTTIDHDLIMALAKGRAAAELAAQVQTGTPALPTPTYTPADIESWLRDQGLAAPRTREEAAQILALLGTNQRTIQSLLKIGSNRVSAAVRKMHTNRGTPPTPPTQNGASS